MTSRRPHSDIAIVWFRQDLRLADNPALAAAVDSGARILPVFVYDDDSASPWQPGAASRWWLRSSLASLKESLDGCLRIFRGEALQIIPELADAVGASAVYWNRCVEPWRATRDDAIKERLHQDELAVRTFNGNYLFDPMTVRKPDGGPYKVFTPYYRNGCLKNAPAPRQPVAAPTTIDCLPAGPLGPFEEEHLIPSFAWFSAATQQWQPGEQGARAALTNFLGEAIHRYAVDRDRPDRHGVSRLSPHLHFGEISPNQVWHAIRDRFGHTSLTEDADRFLAELGWREFCAYQLFHEPQLPNSNLQRRFDRFPWRDDQQLRERWQAGATGYPIVDAGMRELNRTGFMHNRVRMIVASFLVKNLLQDWRHGARWFWEKLLDADLANNSANWQWVAGCGADAAPYFRIFNPVTQGKKFDPDGTYVRCYVPELAELPARYIHEPWAAPKDMLAAAGIRIGDDYPAPIIDLKASRERALDAYRSLSH